MCPKAPNKSRLGSRAEGACCRRATQLRPEQGLWHINGLLCPKRKSTLDSSQMEQTLLQSTISKALSSNKLSLTKYFCCKCVEKQMFTRTYKNLDLHIFSNVVCSYKDKNTIVTIISDRYTVPCHVCSQGLPAMELNY